MSKFVVRVDFVITPTEYLNNIEDTPEAAEEIVKEYLDGDADIDRKEITIVSSERLSG